MSNDDNVFGSLFSELGRNRALDEQPSHPGRNTFRTLPKRFYKAATAAPAEGGHAILLDGRGIKTPARHPLIVPTRALALAIAEEWERQGEFIDPRTMWLTKLANTAIDRVRARREAVIDELTAFAETDLVSYRADHPLGLVEREAAHWSPLVDWARETFGIALNVTTGILPIPQDEAALAAYRKAIAPANAFQLAALHNAVTLTGSATIGLALFYKRLDGAAAFAAAHVDDTWQMEQSGEDEDEAARLASRRIELLDTLRFLELVSDAA